MPRLSKLVVALLTFGALCFGSATMTRADELIINGGFETGIFTGWTVVNQPGSFPGSNFFVSSTNSTPLNSFPTAGPASGSFNAVTDQGGAGTHALLQTFVVPAGQASVILSFDMFVNNQNGNFVNPAGLNFNALPNQHARVDLLTAGAGALSTAPADVLRNFYLGSDAGPNPHPYTHYVFDITPQVGAGGTFQIRFAEVDNQFFFNLGVDNVSINATSTAPVPEPTTLLLLGTGLVGVAAKAYRRRKPSKSEEA